MQCIDSCVSRTKSQMGYHSGEVGHTDSCVSRTKSQIGYHSGEVGPGLKTGHEFLANLAFWILEMEDYREYQRDFKVGKKLQSRPDPKQLLSSFGSPTSALEG